MSTEGRQDTLFEEPIGLRLRATREKVGLTQEQVGQQLRLPVAVVEAMEREDWQRLGAPVYVRSYLGSYLRLLGLPETLMQPVLAPVPAPQLVPMASRSRLRRSFDRGLRNVVYLVMTAVLVVPVVLVARHYQNASLPETLTLEPDAALLPALGADAPAVPTRTPSSPAEAAGDVAGHGPEPVMASITPMPSRPSPAPTVAAGLPDAPEAALVLRFEGQSWLEVDDRQGRPLERALVDAGAVRTYAAGEVGRITLGNAAAVQVLHGGEPVDLSPWRAANVARFTVSSAGVPEPAR